jgi:hypothetical protein
MADERVIERGVQKYDGEGFSWSFWGVLPADQTRAAIRRLNRDADNHRPPYFVAVKYRSRPV